MGLEEQNIPTILYVRLIVVVKYKAQLEVMEFARRVKTALTPQRIALEILEGNLTLASVAGEVQMIPVLHMVYVVMFKVYAVLQRGAAYKQELRPSAVVMVFVRQEKIISLVQRTAPLLL